MELREPPRRARQQVQRHYIILPEPAGQQIFCFQLVVGIGKTRLDTVAVQHDQLRIKAGRFQNIVNAIQQCGVRFQTGTHRRHLNGRRFTIKIRKGVDHTYQQRGQDQQILPQWILVHYSLLITALVSDLRTRRRKLIIL